MTDSERRVVDFDHHRPIAEVDPEGVYAELRQACPVAWSAKYGGYWVLTRYDEVVAALKDYQTYSSKDGDAIPAFEFARVGPSPPIHMDPPEAEKYRKALKPFLTRTAVAALEDRIDYWTTRCIDEVIESGQCDLVADIASPVPGAVTLELLGWSDISEARRISQAWHDNYAYPSDHPEARHVAHELAWFGHRIDEELADRRTRPRDDLITHIATHEIDGEQISDDYARKMIATLVGGGVDTTTSVIASALVHLHYDPDQKQELIDAPALWETAASELLRRYPPIWTLGRTVLHDTIAGGCALKAGERVLVGIGSACQDDAIFIGGDRVDLARTPNPHAAFGFGVHRCIGMHLAMAEFATVMKQVLARMPDYRLQEDSVVRYTVQAQLSGWISIPAVFTQGARQLAVDAV